MNQIAGNLLSKIERREAHVGVVGLGYVGLPLVLLFSDQKFAITGFDIDQRKVETLTSGGSYIVRIDPAQVQSARARGFTATCDYSRMAEMDAVIICVPTPLDEFRQPDMSYIVSACEEIAKYLHPGMLVILESTTYPGTTEEVLVPILGPFLVIAVRPGATAGSPRRGIAREGRPGRSRPEVLWCDSNPTAWARWKYRTNASGVHKRSDPYNTFLSVTTGCRKPSPTLTAT